MSKFSLPALNEHDKYPLWSFGYEHRPHYDNPNKVVTARGRTPREAWICVQHFARSFLEPKCVGLLGVMPITEAKEYSKTHRYEWLTEPPLWLKIDQGRVELIFQTDEGAT